MTARLVGLVSALCVDVHEGRGDASKWDRVIDALAQLPEADAAEIAKRAQALLSRTDRDAAIASAWTLSRIIFRSSLKAAFPSIAAAAAEPPKPSSTRSILSKAAFRLLNRGAGARDLVEQVRTLNRMQPAPLPDTDVDRLIIWVAQRKREESADA